jgi:hypothetical protein
MTTPPLTGSVAEQTRDPVILAIDPGPVQSAWIAYNGEIIDHGFCDNEQLLSILRGAAAGVVYVGRHPRDVEKLDPQRVVIEKVEGFGMPVGVEVFETVFWSGRFAEAASPIRVDRIGRKAVKLHLCGTVRAKDPNVRQALIDRFGGSDAIGRKASPGPLHGISGDVWSALAVAVTWTDQHVELAA